MNNGENNNTSVNTIPNLNVGNGVVQTNSVINQGTSNNSGVQQMPSITNNDVVQQVNNTSTTNVATSTSNTHPAQEAPKVEKTKKKINFSIILLILLLALGFYTIYSSNSYKQAIATLNYNCTPITASREEVKLDLNSTLVKELYGRVVTNIREDLAEIEFNDSMKLYLAYRQIPDSEKYDSNCNLFNSQTMEPFKCEESLQFVPKAFKEDTLRQKLKELFGEKTQINLANVQLGSACIGGYQYIPDRGEFVQGYCSQTADTSYKVTKNLTEAVSNRNTITLVEEVKYHENEKMPLPARLKSGIYRYVFRLDMNYNYVLISKTYEEKY